jgi:phytoene/squalene synthetase
MDPLREKFIESFEKIDFEAIKDHPNILIAAAFWENDRYCAAKSCYRFMRYIDDMIDNHKAEKKLINRHEREEFLANVNSWLSLVFSSDDCNSEGKELLETMDRFLIPAWTMEAFAKSMIWDIYHDGFPTLGSFLDYSGGASVAPASVFVHLNGLRRVNGHFEVPPFDVRWAATPCAIFSYLVHIIRDFRKDQLNNLTYFADDMISENGLTRNDLREFAEGRPVNEGFRKIIASYYTLAGEYRSATFDVLKKIKPLLEPRYQLSLDIIFSLYMMVYERIDARNGSFTSEELNPTPAETRIRVYETILKFKPAF